MEQDTRYDICPKCGGRKRTVSKTCKKCQSQSENLHSTCTIDYSLATPLWIAEFSGLFWGEGSAMIVRNNTSFAAILCIRLRDDDYEVIRDIQQTLGGRLLHRYLHKKNPKHGNQVEWRTTNMEHILEIGNLVLEHSAFEAKKKHDLQRVLEFCAWRLNQDRFMTPSQREEAEKLMYSLRNSRLYCL